MAGTQLTSEMAIGAAWLTANKNERVECWIEAGDIRRLCALEACEDESGERVHLAHQTSEGVRRAVVATSRVRVSGLLSVRLKTAYKLSQETPAEREQREANEKLWAKYEAGRRTRRNPSGQFAGHHCEPAGRR